MSTRLKDSQIARLGESISKDSLKIIALGRMGISYAMLKNIECDKGDAKGFNREILKHWRNRNLASSRVSINLNSKFYRLTYSNGSKIQVRQRMLQLKNRGF